MDGRMRIENFLQQGRYGFSPRLDFFNGKKVAFGNLHDRFLDLQHGRFGPQPGQ